MSRHYMRVIVWVAAPAGMALRYIPRLFGGGLLVECLTAGLSDTREFCVSGVI